MTVKRAIELGLWMTRGGMLVRVPVLVAVDGKVRAFRYPTGGWHGMLWRNNLRSPKAVELRGVKERS